MCQQSDHEQSKSQPRLQRKQGESQHQPDSNGSAASRRAGGKARNQSQRSNRAVRQRTAECRGTSAGGILRQLIARADSQLARIDDRIRQFEIDRQSLQQERGAAMEERAQLQRLLENLQQTIQDED